MIGLVLLGIAAFGAFGFFVLNGTKKAQKDAERNSEHILDEAFDGSPNVTFKINMQSVKYETVIIGAKARGYELTHQADGKYGPQTLMFEKTDR